MPQQRQLLYLSHLVPSESYDVYAAISQVSRKRNQADGIDGVLLFDGHRFCQWIEGPDQAVAETAARIARDPRHHFMVTLLERVRPAPAEGGAARWQSGYCEPDALDCFEGPQALHGEPALAAFLEIVARADLAP